MSLLLMQKSLLVNVLGPDVNLKTTTDYEDFNADDSYIFSTVKKVNFN